MTRLFANNAATTLAVAISSTGDTSCTLTSDTNFPTISGSDYYMMTIDDDTNIEIVKVTAATGTAITTMVRAQEGTTAATFAIGAKAEIRETAEAFSDVGINVTDNTTNDVSITAHGFAPKAPNDATKYLDGTGAWTVPAGGGGGGGGGGGSGAFSFISSQTASASSSLDFTGLGDYSYIEFVFNDILPVTDDVEFHIRTSTDNGSTYDSGASDYNYAHQGRSGGTTLQVSSVSSKIILCQGAAGLDVSNVAGEGVAGSLKLFNPTAAVNKAVTWHINYTNGIGSAAVVHGGGRRNSAADVDAVRFLFSSGNIASGTIYAYGISKT